MIRDTPHTNYTHCWHHLFILFLILFFHFFPLLPLQAYDWAYHLPWAELAVPWTWTDAPSLTSCQLHHFLLELQKTARSSVTAHPPPAAECTQPTSSAISSRALLLLSHRDRYMVVSFSSFLIFLVIWVK